jgi:hypothetical protein
MANTFKLIQVTNPTALQPKMETIAVGTKESVSHDMAWEISQWRKAGGEVIIDGTGTIKLNESDGSPKLELYITTS